MLGSGLGLSIVQETVNAAHGTITVRSSLGEGTVFSVELPVKWEAVGEPSNNLNIMNKEKILVEQNLIESFELNLDKRNKSKSHSHRLQILVVDDNHDLLEMIDSIVSAHFDCILHNNGEDAIKDAVDLVPDLVISDINMPQMSGYNVLERLKSDIATSHIPVIMLTAFSSVDNRIKAWKYEADGFLQKPFVEEELLTLINALLSNRKKSTSEDDNSDENVKVDELSRDFLNKVDEYIEENISLTINIETFANRLKMTTRTFQRKIKSLVDLTPSEYILQYKLSIAKRMLIEGDSENDIIAKLGFKSKKKFTSEFIKLFEKPPDYFKTVR